MVNTIATITQFAVYAALIWLAIRLAKNIVARWRSFKASPKPKVRFRKIYEPANVVCVIDGDTLDVEVGSWSDRRVVRVRVLGIDAPESLHPDPWRNTPAGAEATAFARAEILRGQQVWLEKDAEDRDAYGRYLRHVWLEDPTQACNVYARSTFESMMLISGHAEPDIHWPNIAHAMDIYACVKMRKEGAIS